MKIHYRKITKYKYQLMQAHARDLDIFPYNRIEVPFVYLSTGGNLLIMDGYAWDGCSGPTYDTESNMRAGLIHDAIYQLIRDNHISKSYQEYADKLFHQILLEDGMGRFRAWYFYLGVKYFGKYALKQEEKT